MPVEHMDEVLTNALVFDKDKGLFKTVDREFNSKEIAASGDDDDVVIRH